MTKENLTANSLKEGFEKAKTLDWQNGLATNPVFVERLTEKVKIIRKSSGLHHPEIFLIIAIPKNGYKEPNVIKLGKDIKESLGLYGDINIVFKRSKRADFDSFTYDCVINVF